MGHARNACHDDVAHIFPGYAVIGKDLFSRTVFCDPFFDRFLSDGTFLQTYPTSRMVSKFG